MNSVILFTMSMSKINLFVCIPIVICSLSSCISIGHTRVLAVFKNCTNDTVYIGASHYDNIDSVSEQVSPHYNFVGNNGLDISDISLWKRTYFRSDNFIYPDTSDVHTVMSLGFLTSERTGHRRLSPRRLWTRLRRHWRPLSQSRRNDTRDCSSMEASLC